MSEDYKVQISGNIGAGLFVLRGNNAAELLAQAKDLATEISSIYDVLGDVKQITTVKEVFAEKKSFNGGGAKPAAAGGGYQNKPQAVDTATSDPDGGYTCKHGKMKFLDYTSAAGKEIKGFYCQAPRGATDKCAAKK